MSSEMAAEMRPWKPIVVGEPMFDFEPKPTPPGSYRPDTFCDGWSTAGLVVRLACVRGYAHRYGGEHRQDDVEVSLHRPSGAVVLAVADGVSAASMSHVGAAVACAAAVRSVLGALDQDDTVDWAEVVRSAGQELIRYAGFKRLPNPAELSTTLVVGLVRPDPDGAVATLVQIGDSGAWLLRDDKFRPVLSDKLGGTVVSSAVSALPDIPSDVVAIDVRVPHGGVLLVGTDGFGDPLGDGTGMVGRLFADALTTPPPPLGLAHALDFSRELFDDDRTLVAVWPAKGRAR